MILSLSMLVPVHASNTDFNPVYSDFKNAENEQLTLDEITSILEVFSSLIPLSQYATIANFAMSLAGSVYGAMSTNERADFLSDLLTYCGGEFNGQTLLCEFSSGALLSYDYVSYYTDSNIFMIYDTLEVEANDSTTYYGEEGVRGTWRQNNYFPEE